MKKISKLIISALLACCFAASLSACIEGGVEEHRQIVKEYSQLHDCVGKQIDYRCYGEFEGTHVMVIQPHDYVVSPAINRVEVDGVDFYFWVMISFDVYRDGEFYTLQAAFEEGWISHEDLLTVRANHKAENIKLYEEYGSEEEHERMAADFAERTSWWSKNDIYYRCYGEFNGAHVAILHHKNAKNFTNAITNDIADGVDFHFPERMSFEVYRDGEFCTLQEAFDRGWLTHENLLTLRRTHRAENEEAYESFEEHREVVEAFARQFNTQAWKVSYHCYGEFDGTHALLFYVVDWGTAAAVTHDYADGVYYHFGSGQRFYVYHEGEYYTLQEAFDNGWLTHEDLLTVRDNYMPGGATYCPKCTGHEDMIWDYAEKFGVPFYKVDYHCYGEFDGTHVTVMTVDGAGVGQAINNVQVDGVDFWFHEMITFDVYHEGRFYTLREAFDEGWLTHEDLLTVRANHKAEYQWLYEEFGDEEAHARLIGDYARLHGCDGERISVECYGAFAFGTHVVVISVEGEDVDTAINHVQVDGVDFYFNVMVSFDVYSEGEFYTLQEAFDNRLLSHDNLLAIRARHRAANQSLYEAFEGQ